jgi:hypothetical protein
MSSMRDELGAVPWSSEQSEATVRIHEAHLLHCPRITIRKPLVFRSLALTVWLPLVLIIAAFGLSACVQGQRATDTGDPGFPFGPTTIGVQPLSYAQDIKPILDRDCLSCHSAREARGNYSVATYADVMNGQTRGDAKSSLVVTGSPGGSMYQYFSGDAVTESTMLFRWLVYYNARQTR